MAEGEYFTIEKIIGKRIIKGKVEYKIKWEGYSMAECTWEPIENLATAKELVEEYEHLNSFPKQKSVKQDTNKKDNSFINKKRNKDNNQQNENIIQDSEEKIEENENNKAQENTQNDLNNEEEVNLVNNNSDNVEDTPNQNINFNKNKRTFIVNDDLKNVVTVKQQGQTLMAIVEKMDESGNVNRISIPTEELRKINPWILLNFYESKIKFT